MQTWHLVLVLGGIGLALMFFLRREPRTSRVRALVESPAEPTLPAATPVVPLPSPSPLVAPAVGTVIPKEPPIVRKVRKKRASPRPLIASPQPAPLPQPVAVAVALLRNQKSLATAFLLREILDAPVSRRRV
jgi:hypothetical protein